jgi:hypothetical protein
MEREPGDRFRSAAEMADELVHVLHEIVIRGGGSAPPVASRRFEATAHPTGEDADGTPLGRSGLHSRP